MGSGGGDASSVLSSGGRTQKSSGSSKLSHGATARDSGGSSGHCTHRSEPPPRIQVSSSRRNTSFCFFPPDPMCRSFRRNCFSQRVNFHVMVVCLHIVMAKMVRSVYFDVERIYSILKAKMHRLIFVENVIFCEKVRGADSLLLVV